MSDQRDENPSEEGTAALTPPGLGASSPADDPLLGRRLDDRYELKLVLGKGGMGTVYLAEDSKLGRRVALKLMGGLVTQEKEFRSRFEREALLQANLPHPQIIQIMDTGETAEGPYIVMEYSGGRSLSRLLRELGPLPVNRALDIALQILEVLDFAHGQSVIHRDLKPANILIEERAGKEIVRLLDFGIAKLISSEGGEEFEHTLTKHGAAYGTLGYMAPEQARGDIAKVDHRVDIYAVGIMLHEMLTGKVPAPPESRGHPGRYAVWVAENPIKPLAETHPQLEGATEIDAFLGGAVRRAPENRYPSAFAFRTAIRESRDRWDSPTVPAAASLHVPATELLPSVDASPRGTGPFAWMVAGLLAAATAIACFLYVKAESAAKEAAEQLKNVRASLLSLEIPSEDLDAAFVALQARMTELETAARPVDAQRLADLQEALGAAQATLDKATKAASAKDGELELGRRALQEAEEKRERAEAGLAESKTAMEASDARGAKLEAEVARLKGRSDEHDATLGALRTQKEALDERVTKQVEENAALTQRLTDLDAQNSVLEKENRRLREKPTDNAVAAAAAKEREAKLRGLVEAANERVRELQEKLDATQRPPVGAPNRTLTIHNAFAHPVRIVRFQYARPGADPETEPLVARTDISAGLELTFPVPDGVTAVTVVYYRWDWANKQFPKRPIAKQVVIGETSTRVNVD
ncbi:MAG: protein kinase [Planctomycetota bacterium]|nr:protein kinase [Planctomycetota bacterium]